MKLISEIIQEEIIDKLDNSLEIVSLEEPVTVGDLVTQEVTFCCLKWLKLYNQAFNSETEEPFKVYSISGKTVKFELIEGNNAIELNTPLAIKKPILFNGTLLNTQLEWTKLTLDEREKLPFIWLESPTPETFGNDETGIARTSACRLWFVHWSDWQLLNANRQAEAIKPLSSLVEEFIATIDRNTIYFAGYDNFLMRDFPKFGTQAPNGAERSILSATLSALGVDISVKILKRYCENC